MSWVKEAISQLSQGLEAKVRPHGSSMGGRIETGQLVTIEPANFESVEIDDIIFLKWKNNYLLHLVKEKTEGQVLIGNNLGQINGWACADSVLGRVINVED